MTPPPPSRVLVVGDLNPDLILRGDVVPRFGQAEQLLDEASLVVGGSAGITAHALARLARPVSIVAAIGTDTFGAEVTAELHDVGVDIEPVLRRANTPSGLTVVLSRADDRAILTLPGAIPTLTAAEVEAAVARLPGLAHAHVSSLFLVPGLAAELPRLLPLIRARGVSTSLDTNADPAGRWLGVEPLLPHLDVLLPNRAEVIALGGDPDPVSAARRLAAAGPLVVVKDGADGAFAVDPAGTLVSVAGIATTVLDTTGAGDTFGAAFLDGWLSGRPLVTCLERAVLAAALSVNALGGTAGQPTQNDLSITRKGS